VQIAVVTLHGGSGRPRKGPIPVITIEAVLLATTPLLPLLRGKTATFRTMAVTFVAIVRKALPFMLVGSMAGGFVEVFTGADKNDIS
jgi:hypothetical protein